MSIEILHDAEGDVAVFTDSVTGWAFGPVIGGPDADDKAAHFEEWLRERGMRIPRVPRLALEVAYGEWLSEHVCADCSTLLDPPDTVHMHGCKHYEEEL